MDGRLQKVATGALLLFIALLYCPFLHFIGFVLAEDPASLLIAARSLAPTLAFTAIQASLSTALAVLTGLPGAFLIRRGPLRAALSIPFALPSILVTLILVSFWGRSGPMIQLTEWLTDLEYPDSSPLYSLLGILLAHQFTATIVTIRIVGDAWRALDPRMERIARALGSTPLAAFTRVTLPQLVPAILQAATLTFLLCMTSFVIILNIGAHPRFTTLEVAAYQAVRSDLHLSTAAAAGIIQIVLALLLVALLRRTGRWTSRTPATYRRTPSLARWIYIVPIATILLGPLATFVATVAQSVTDVPSWSFLLREHTLAIANSFFFAGGTLAIVLMISVLAAISLTSFRASGKREWIATAFLLPVALSPVVSAFCLVYLFRENLSALFGSRTAVLYCHTLIALPYAAWMLFPHLRAARLALLRVSRTLHATEGATLRTVLLPLIRPGLLSAGLLAFIVSLGEVSAILMLYADSIRTLPVAIHQAMGRYDFDGAYRLAFLLILILGAGTLLFESVRERDMNDA